MRRTVFAALILASAACVTAPPARVAAPLAAPSRARTFPGLTLALKPSPNTEATAPYLQKWQADMWPVAATIVPEQPARDLAEAVVRQFAPPSGSADLNGLLDAHFELPRSVYGVARIDVDLALTDASGRVIDRFAVSKSLKVTDVTPFGMAFKRMKATFLMTLEQALAELDRAVAGSRALAAHAPKRGGAPAVAAFTRVSDVDAPKRRKAEDPKLFALIIGVERYESLPSADYAERDAEAVRENVRALGAPDRNIMFLSGARAGKAALEKSVESWLPEHAGPGTRVFVYFSGHGTPDLKTGSAYLMPFDGDPKYVETTGYPLKRLYAKLGALPAASVLVALDSCFSGAGGRSVLPSGMRPLVARVDEGTSELKKISVLAASGADEVTGAFADQGHGLFTYYLLKAIQEGSGDARALHESLSPRVRDAASRDNREQTPRLLGPGDASF